MSTVEVTTPASTVNVAAPAAAINVTTPVAEVSVSAAGAITIASSADTIQVTTPAGTVNVGAAISSVEVTTALAHVISSDVILGSADCPVTIHTRSGSTAETYSRTTGAANLALLQTLFTNLGANGGKVGTIVQPAGRLQVVGKLSLPRNVSGVWRGVGGRAIGVNAVREPSWNISELFLERADADASANWCPAIGMQTLGPIFQDLYIRSRVVVSNAWVGVEPSHLLYSATTSISSGQPGFFPGFVADSGVGTGKQHFDRCNFNHGPNCGVLSLGHPESPTANNADTPTFSDCHFNGNGSIIDSYTEQALVFTFRDCDFLPQYDGEDIWPTLVNLYRGGTVHFIRGTFLHPMRCVRAHWEGGSGKLVRFEGCKLDNNIFKVDPAGGATGLPGMFMFFDGRDAGQLQSIAVVLRDIEWTNVGVPATVAIPPNGTQKFSSPPSTGFVRYEADSNAVSTANPGMVAVGSNQKLLVEGCWGIQANLFSTHNIVRSGANAPQGIPAGNYTYYPDVTIRDSSIRGVVPVFNNQMFRTTGSPGAKYNYRLRDCMDELNRKFDDYTRTETFPNP
jgi:hypothetical protein